MEGHTLLKLNQVNFTYRVAPLFYFEISSRKKYSKYIDCKNLEFGNMLKKCTRCKIEKDKSEFYKNKNMSDGLNSWCKDCVREYKREWQHKNKEYLSKQSVIWARQQRQTERGYKKHWCSTTLSNHRSKGYNTIISTKELYDIIEHNVTCDLCGKSLEWWPTGKLSDASPTLDRIDNDINITSDNIQILCHQCNSGKKICQIANI